jgi:FkbM family methyltransferase
MKTLLYRAIYQPFVNKVLRALLFPFRNLLPQKALLPPSGVVSFTIKKGQTVKMATNQTSFVTWNIFWKGYDSYEYVPVFEKLGERISVFFDVGANTGLYSLLLHAVNPKAKSYAFEPSPGPFRYLNENISINGAERCIFSFSTALAGESGELTFVSAYSPKYAYLRDATLGGSGHLSGARSDTSAVSFKVKTQTLGDFVKEHRIEQIDLMKLDTEETEHLIVGAGIEVIRKFEPVIVCEVFSPEMANALFGLLNPLGYTPYIAGNAALRKADTVEFKGGDIPNCFFVPQSKLSWIEDLIVS